MVRLGKGKNKKVELSLLVHPQWLMGSSKDDDTGQPFGGSAQDDVDSTARWNRERASKIRLLEIRGELPEEVTCPETGLTIKTARPAELCQKNQLIPVAHAVLCRMY